MKKFFLACFYLIFIFLETLFLLLVGIFVSFFLLGRILVREILRIQKRQKKQLIIFLEEDGEYSSFSEEAEKPFIFLKK